MSASLDVARYLAELRAGDESAFHSLTDDPVVVGPLIEAYAIESDPEMRTLMIELICYHGKPEAFAPLAAAVVDDHEAVWKAALDGFVHLAGELGAARAEAGLQAAKAKLTVRDELDAGRIEWLEEAIVQAWSTGLAGFEGDA